MPRPTPQQYLESKVLTASQPQLHMMLLDGALRFVSQAHAIWADGEEAAEVDLLLGRAMDVLEELTQGVTNGSTKISEEMEEQYAFLYREIAASRINQDLSRLSKCPGTAHLPARNLEVGLCSDRHG